MLINLVNAPWKAEVVTVLAEPTVDGATCGALMNLLLAHDGPAAAVDAAPPVGAAIGVQRALAAYARFVHFKSASLGLMPLAAATSGRSSGELLTRTVIQGTTTTVLTNCKTNGWTDVEFIIAILFRFFTDIDGLNVALSQAPSTGHGLSFLQAALGPLLPRAPAPPAPTPAPPGDGARVPPARNDAWVSAEPARRFWFHSVFEIRYLRWSSYDPKTYGLILSKCRDGFA